MNGFLPSDFSRTGRAGKMIDIGKDKELGVFRTINHNHFNRSRNSDNKGNSNFNSVLKFSNQGNNRRFNNQDNNHRYRDLKENLRLSNQVPIEYRNQNSNRRFNNQGNNLRRRFSSRRDNLRLNSQNVLSLQENLKGGTKSIKGRMTKS
jgi:hypothetical protein